MTNYVYQFVIVPDGKNKFGLVFSEECETYNSPIFAVSTENNLFSTKFRFPGEINGKYREFDLQANENYLSLSTSSIKTDLRFTYSFFLDDDYFFFRRRFMKDPFYPYYRLKYIGKFEHKIEHGKEFQIIIPRDLITMDRLYRENKFCLVGYTPTFNSNEQ